MSNIEDFPVSARKMSEYDALVAAGHGALDAIPGAVYLCDHEGWLVRYNTEAAELWGRSPLRGEKRDRFCGSHRLFLPDGTPLPHDKCPMAAAVSTGEATRNAEVIIERPDGSRLVALVNIQALRDHNGRIQGAINCFQDITEHKAIEEEVRRKSADLEDFFENSAIGLHIVNGGGTIQRANKAELALLGYTEDEYIGRHIAEFHVDAPATGEILRKLSCGEKLEQYPARLRAKDGSVKHVLITSNSRCEGGQLVNTKCFTTDVTSLHTAEQARRDSEERLAATYEAATVGIAEADAEGRLLRVNDAICRILGRSRKDLLGISFFDLTHEEDRENDLALYAQQVHGELESYVLSKRVTRPDGAIVYLEIHSSSVRDEFGGFRHGVRVIQDVTEAKRMQDRIRESEQHMRDLLEALPAAVYTTDAAGHITFYNKAAVEMSGRTPQPGDRWCVTHRGYNPDGSPLLHEQCPMALALRENRPVRGREAIAERPDGTRIPFIPYPTPLHDANGNLVGGINMLVDITERKRAENRQKLLIDELNHRVKNTLATVQSMAGQTARHSADLKDFSERFEARLLALARAHDLLTRRHWGDVPLAALAREVLTPLAGENAERVIIDGPAVSLTPRAGLSLTIALNELVTNAAKYGALSSEAGVLSLIWRRDPKSPSLLNLDWREQGGPPVTVPTRRGFGVRLMTHCVKHDLAGEFDLAFEPTGVTCNISFPLEQPKHDDA